MIQTANHSFHICAVCADELIERLRDELPTITDNSLPLGERLDIRRAKARRYADATYPPMNIVMGG